MAKPTAEEFIAALRQCEEHGNVDALAALHADDARVSNPTAHEPQVGPEGARHFWDTYRRSFTRIHSTFHAVLESEQRAMLEWTSECETVAGLTTKYDGVSVFETRDGKITRFVAYFDPHALAAKPDVRSDEPRAIPASPRADQQAHEGGAFGTAPRQGDEVVDAEGRPAH